MPVRGWAVALKLLQQAEGASRYSRFYEVGFLQALAACASETKRGPLTADPAARGRIEKHALELAMKLRADCGSDHTLGKINKNNNPLLADSLFLGTRATDEKNGEAFRELQKKLASDSMGRRSVLAAAKRSLWTTVTLHTARPYTNKKFVNKFNEVRGNLAGDSPTLAGRLNDLKVSEIRTALQL